MSPGFKTTEFYLITLQNLLTAFLAAGFLPDTSPVVKIVAFAASTLSTLGYVYGRSYLKANDATLKQLKQ